MDTLETIYSRRATRRYTGQSVAESAVQRLIEAAIQAPSGMNEQPWAFVVVQDKALLRRISQKALTLLGASADLEHVPAEIREQIDKGTFDIFYGAGTLVVICAHAIRRT